MPPVERICTPSASRLRANCTTPDLSETLTSARATFTSGFSLRQLHALIRSCWIFLRRVLRSMPSIAAAAMLGIDRNTLRKKIQQLRIKA